MHSIQQNRNDDDYALISYVCAYSLQTSTSYIGHIHKVKNQDKDLRSSFSYFYVLSFDHADFTLKIQLYGLNDLIRTFEARTRIRGFVPLIDRNLYLTNTIEL